MKNLVIAVGRFEVIFVDGGEDVTFVTKKLHSLSVKQTNEVT